jgi:hypothetical protein
MCPLDRPNVGIPIPEVAEERHLLEEPILRAPQGRVQVIPQRPYHGGAVRLPVSSVRTRLLDQRVFPEG